MPSNHEKSPHSVEKVEEKELDTIQVIEALTPDAIMKLKFFDNLVDSALKNGKIDEKTAKLITLTSRASARTATLQ